MPRTWAGKFLLTVGVVFIAVLVCGWFTGAKQVMHSALLAVTTFAFLPFVLLFCVIGICITIFLFSLIAAIFSGDGYASGGEDVLQPVGEAVIKRTPAYYRWLAERKHPVFWGIPVGTLIGGLILWGLIYGFIVPKEMKTSEKLLSAQQLVETYFETKRSFPQATAAGSFPAKTDTHTEEPLLDGFGRPFVYETTQTGDRLTYHIKSHGFDGKPGKDDFCVSGSASLKKESKLIAAIKLWNQVRPDKAVPVKERLQMVRDLKCQAD